MMPQKIKLSTRRFWRVVWLIVTYMSFVAMIWRLAHHTVFEHFFPMLPWTFSWGVKWWRQWKRPKS